MSAARGVSFGAVTEALSFGHGIALVLELGKLPAPLLARCDFVRVLVEVIDVRAHDLDRPHAGATDPICKEVSSQEADSDEDGVDNCSRTNANLHLRGPPVRVRRPVWPHVRTDQPARRANHPAAQGAHRGLVRQPVGIHDGAVVAPARHAIDKEAAAAVAANVGERNRIEGLGLAWSHGDPTYGLS